MGLRRKLKSLLLEEHNKHTDFLPRGFLHVHLLLVTNHRPVHRDSGLRGIGKSTLTSRLATPRLQTQLSICMRDPPECAEAQGQPGRQEGSAAAQCQQKVTSDIFIPAFFWGYYPFYPKYETVYALLKEARRKSPAVENTTEVRATKSI